MTPAFKGRAGNQICRTDCPIFDIHVEVDANPFEERIVQANEADFDGDLQILQAAQLLEQVGDFLMDGLRLADDETQVRGEGTDFGGAAAVFGPRFGLDGGDN